MINIIETLRDAVLLDELDAIHIIEYIIKNSTKEVHLIVYTSPINEEPYKEIVYSLSIGQEYEDEGECCYYEPKWCGFGNSLVGAVKNLVELSDKEKEQ